MQHQPLEQTMKTYLDRLLALLVMVNMTTLVFVVLWQVFSRFFQIANTITDELACIQMVGIALLGGAYTVGQKRHLCIDVFSARLQDKAKTLSELFSHLTLFLFALCTMILGGIWLFQITLETGQRSPALGIPAAWLYLPLPVAGFFICSYCALFTAELLTSPQGSCH